MSDDSVRADQRTEWRPIPGGSEGTWSSPVETDRGRQAYRLGRWKGAPGVYQRPAGMPWSEMFVVYRGRGKVSFADRSVDLYPGAVVNLNQGEPYVLSIDETLEKFAVITLPAQEAPPAAR